MKKINKAVKKVKALKKIKAAKPAPKAKKPVAKAKPVVKAKPVKVATVKSAPKAKEAKTVVEAPPKLLKLNKQDATKYKALLLNLRDHLIDGVSFLAGENLKRTGKDAAGELSGYSMHMADAGTDNFDREFALSLVSNEQEALYEIEEALKRLESSMYGLCAICEKPIRKERLEAVPFARCCVQCQSDVEKNKHGVTPQGGLFTENADDEGEGDEGEE